jgi:hypothetical protein
MASARGVFNGHLNQEADKINRIGQLRQGVVKVIENWKPPDVARKWYHRRYDYGYGVAEAFCHYYNHIRW